MRVQIICFSPSGNTLAVGREIREQLISRQIPCAIANLTGESVNLHQLIQPHDVLLLGGPVYAHHLHYNVLDLIGQLPACDQVWGKLAIPYVTYGGISSGIALQEAGKALRKAGRIVVAGMKVAASHRMTRAFMEREFNSDLPLEPMQDAVYELVDRILALRYSRKPMDAVPSMSYNGFATALKAKLIFQEKKWHRGRYPKVSIDTNRCTSCGACTKICPVMHLCKGSDGKIHYSEKECIHCLNCVVSCPQKAIQLVGDMEKGRRFMSRMIAHHGNTETPATGVYPLREAKILLNHNRVSNWLFNKMLKSLERPTRSGRTAPEMLRDAGVAEANSILEVGCGSGYFTRHAETLLGEGTSYTAIDLHPEAVRQTKEKLSTGNTPRIRVLQCNALKTKMPDQKFDLILLFGIIPSPFLPLDQLMPEMLRILAPGGKIAIWTMDRFWNKERLEYYPLQWTGTQNGIHHYLSYGKSPANFTA